MQFISHTAKRYTNENNVMAPDSTDLPECTAAINLLDGLFEHLLDFTAREVVELAVTKSTVVIKADDHQHMADVAVRLIDKFDRERPISDRLKERVRLFLDAK